MKSIKKVLGCFQNSDAIGKIQQGSAWWFNDNKIGMEIQHSSNLEGGELYVDQ